MHQPSQQLPNTSYHSGETEHNIILPQLSDHSYQTLIETPSAAFHVLQKGIKTILRSGILRIISIPSTTETLPFIWVGSYSHFLSNKSTVVKASYLSSTSYFLIEQQGFVHAITIPKDSQVEINLDGYFRLICLTMELQQALSVAHIKQALDESWPNTIERQVYIFDKVSIKMIQGSSFIGEGLTKLGVKSHEKIVKAGDIVSKKMTTLTNFQVHPKIKQGAEATKSGVEKVFNIGHKVVNMIVNPFLKVTKKMTGIISDRIEQSNIRPLRYTKGNLITSIFDMVCNRFQPKYRLDFISTTNQTLCNSFEGISNLVVDIGSGIGEGTTTIVYKKFGKPGEEPVEAPPTTLSSGEQNSQLPMIEKPELVQSLLNNIGVQRENQPDEVAMEEKQTKSSGA